MYSELFWKIKRHFTIYENLNQEDFDIIVKEVQALKNGANKVFKK